MLEFRYEVWDCLILQDSLLSFMYVVDSKSFPCNFFYAVSSVMQRIYRGCLAIVLR